MYRTGHSQVIEKPCLHPWEFSHHHAGAYKQNSIKGGMPSGEPASGHNCKRVCGHDQGKGCTNYPN